VRDFKIISKTLNPLPTQWYGLTDVEERYRKRYLDLIMNKDVRKIFETRSKIITTLRKFLDDDKFIEVETPVLQPLYGGATAKPFKTKLNALNLNLYLRIAPELYLKRLIVGGFEKVYEIAKNFRNEGMDKTHNPEFTAIELYIAYKDYNYLMEFTEKMFLNIVNSVFQHHEIEFQGEKINFNKLPWQRIEFETLVNNELGEDYKKISLEKLNKKLKELKIEADPKIKTSKIKLIDEIYKKLTLPRIIQPTFIINHPIEISPLAKEKEDDPTKVERFQLIVGGLEIVNAFSELNNPIEQEKRFKNQKKLKEKGDEEAQNYDTDFIEALEYGMPPTAGLGIGIDRLTMLLTNSPNIKEVLLFPTMKEKKK
ncbi:lysine--tRNA ligase, partial [Candidatus Azambacteria bacterium]|nr:lysine--tRNA ligase [Candidatus Azambacteria bacterium]